MPAPTTQDTSTGSDDLDDLSRSLDEIIAGDAATRGRGGANVVGWIVAGVITAVFLGAVGVIAFLTGTSDQEDRVTTASLTTAITPASSETTVVNSPTTAPTPAPSAPTAPDLKAKLAVTVEQNQVPGAPMVSSPRICQAVVFAQFIKGENGDPGSIRQVVTCLDDK